MKKTFLILVLLPLAVISSKAQAVLFKWDDTEFTVGSKRILKVWHQLSKPEPVESSKPVLDTLISFMKKNTALKIEIGSYTGPQGSLQHNLAMTQFRALCDRNYLMEHGIDSARIVPKGYGFAHPLKGYSVADIANMKTEKEKQAAYLKDDRIEITILSTCYGHETFNWTDTVFYIGSKRRIHIEYGMDESGVLERSKVILDTVARFLKKNPALKIEFASHTDPQGSYKHDMILSRARAQANADYVIAQGIDSSRIVVKGYGYTSPLPGCSKADIAVMKTWQEKVAAYQADRRNEVVIIGR
jgi:outer membrane protein OmpA-like peptidoglycan-associated protein